MTTDERNDGRFFSVVIVGGGSGGVAVAARLRRARPELDIALVEPSSVHAYQPGWTLVGGGEMKLSRTLRPEGNVVPKGVTWVRQAVDSFQPEEQRVTLADGESLRYRFLVVCPGLQLDWGKIKGLEETLGRNGVTSNYHRETAAYTWECVRNLKKGKAVFTQPAMPIKCAGAPQKAAYLSADYWRKAGVLNDIDVSFCNVGTAIFGVKHFVPVLEETMEYYGIDCHSEEELIAVDGEARQATFRKAGGEEVVTRPFDMLHVVPPQSAPGFVSNSPLAGKGGWLPVDPATLQHEAYPDIFGLGDVIGTGNAKTMAAARDQAPIVAANLLAAMEGRAMPARYDGYGACPLTVSHGRVVLAEFLYGGQVAPSFPYDQRKPSRFAWFLKKDVFPLLYWHGMLKGIDPILRHRPLSGS